MTDSVEPRTVPQMISELLQLVINSQWSGQSRHGCHCHPSFAPCCPECGKAAWKMLRTSDGEYARITLESYAEHYYESV